MRRRRFKLPEEVLWPAEPQTDARPTRGHREKSEPDPEVQRAERLRRHMVRFLFGVVFLAGLFTALFAERGFVDARRWRGELRDLERQTALQRERVVRLRRDVAELRARPSAVERIAREELGLARPGEIVFLLPREEGPSASP